MATKKFINAGGESLVTPAFMNNAISSAVTNVGKAALLIHEDTFTPVVGSSKIYDLNTLLTANASKYDLTKLQVVVEVLDTEVDSVTYNYWINAAAVATVGIKTNGTAIVVNNYDAAITLRTRVYACLI
jgi:hypothetical protein